MIYKDSNGICDNFNNPDLLDYWIAIPHIIGKLCEKAQLFFTVQIELIISQLVQQQLNYIQIHKISLEIKQTKDEFTKRIGFMLGINLNYASVQCYKRNIEHLF